MIKLRTLYRCFFILFFSGVLYKIRGKNVLYILKIILKIGSSSTQTLSRKYQLSKKCTSAYKILTINSVSLKCYTGFHRKYWLTKLKYMLVWNATLHDSTHIVESFWHIPNLYLCQVYSKQLGIVNACI